MHCGGIINCCIWQPFILIQFIQHHTCNKYTAIGTERLLHIKKVCVNLDTVHLQMGTIPVYVAGVAETH